MPKGVYERKKKRGGLCTKCKVNPSNISRGLTHPWCTQCQTEERIKRKNGEILPQPKERKYICTQCNNAPSQRAEGKTKKDVSHLSWCKECTMKYNKQYYHTVTVNRPPETKKHKNLQRDYGITFDDYKAMYDAQDGRCKICREPLDLFCTHNAPHKTCVDHNHTTGKIRGILCSPCNSGIGFFKEDIDIISNAIAYLKEYNNCQAT